MAPPIVAPGPSADDAFRLGLVAATILAVIPLGVLYWMGELAPHELGFAALVGFPVYLVFAASALSVWLGYDKDVTDLRPVYRNRE